MVAHIPGTSGKNVLFTAHFDSHGVHYKKGYYPAADDNASGVATLLNLMQKASSLSQNKVLKVGLVAVFFSAEEWGLKGSRAFAESLQEHQLVSEFIANINLDSLARNQPDKYYILGSLANNQLVEFFTERKPADFGFTLSNRIEFAYQQGSDHYPLHLLGIPSVDFTSSRTAEMDTVNDKIELLDFDKLTRFNQFLESTLPDLLRTNHQFGLSEKKYAPFPSRNTVRHDLQVEVDPSTGKVTIRDRLSLHKMPRYFDLSVQAENLQILLDGEPVLHWLVSPNADKKSLRHIPSYPAKEGQVEIVYDFTPEYRDVNEGGTSLNTITEEVDAVVSEEGVYLAPSSYWYPYIPTEFEKLKVQVKLPLGWKSMTTGDLVFSEDVDEKREEHWNIATPSERLHLIAGEFAVSERIYRGVALQTYFHNELTGISEVYLNKLQRYLDLYMDLFGSYPYSKFAVVSNFFSTGYGMASYTLLDRHIIPYPFIIDTSLGHEMLHNYFGNSLYVDWEKGNWCEGLTVYFADYLYASQRREEDALSYRVNLLRNYQNFVNSSNVFPLSSFTSRSSPASRAIGYGKVMMFFHMLDQKMGREVFIKAVRRMVTHHTYKTLSYEDLRLIFEDVSKLDLKTFFNQWVTRVDTPHLKMSNQYSSDKKSVSISIFQENPHVYELLVPVEVTFEDDSKVVKKLYTKERTYEEFFWFNKMIKEIKLDPAFNLMRTLNDQENPPTLYKFWSHQKTEFYTNLSSSPATSEGLKKVIDAYPLSGESSDVQYMTQGQLDNFIPPKEPSFYFITAKALKTPYFKTLLQDHCCIRVEGASLVVKDQGESYQSDLKSEVAVVNFTHQGKSLVLVIFPEGPIPYRVLGKLSHYGKYSYLGFTAQGRKKYANIWSGWRP